jgi:hypothetical protein
VRPGITGWAQINYKYGDTLQDTITKLEYDLYYIKNMSAALRYLRHLPHPQGHVAVARRAVAHRKAPSCCLCSCVIVLQRPFSWATRLRAVQCMPGICLFSSKHGTSAFSGGFSKQDDARPKKQPSGACLRAAIHASKVRLCSAVRANASGTLHSTSSMK